VIVVESTVWVDYFRNAENRHTLWLEENMLDPRLGLLDLSYCEVLQGIRNDTQFQKARAQLVAFGVHATGGADFALEAAEFYRFLRKRGITVRKTIDCLIATYCIRESHDLVHNDRDFDGFEKYLGLRVVHP
jgi:predicted nucleic acid-binding protein